MCDTSNSILYLQHLRSRSTWLTKEWNWLWSLHDWPRLKSIIPTSSLLLKRPWHLFVSLEQCWPLGANDEVVVNNVKEPSRKSKAKSANGLPNYCLKNPWVHGEKKTKEKNHLVVPAQAAAPLHVLIERELSTNSLLWRWRKWRRDQILPSV